jgi:hypothetical protein
VFTICGVSVLSILVVAILSIIDYFKSRK